MAQNLATITDLKTFRANVRRLTRSEEQQTSGLLDIMMTDMIHFSVVFVRGVLGKLVDDFYTEQKTDLGFTGATPDFTASITAIEMVSTRRMALYHATLKEIPIVPIEQFNAIKTLYAAADIGTTRGVAAVYLTNATPSVLTIGLFSNIAAAPTNCSLKYVRSPRKVTADADTMDLPEYYIPIAQYFAAANVFKKLGQPVPAEIEAPIRDFLQSNLSQIGLELSPQKK